MVKLSRALSERVFKIRTSAELHSWLADVSKEIGGYNKVPLGGIENNVHTVEVASDPASALTERPINAIDALLELAARRKNESAANPHEAAGKWYDVPKGGLSAMTEKERRKLASNILVTMHESEISGSPSISIQDGGTGQHPDDFGETLLSLLKSNKKDKTHVMGVYNAGGAASYRFANGTIVISRLAPDLLKGRPDEIGVSVVLYDELDVEKFRTGVYEYVVAKDNSTLRLDLDAMPNGLDFGTYVMLLEYQMPKYANLVYRQKQSLWQLFHAALPSPPLPFQIVETRKKLLPKEKTTESRVVNGLIHLVDKKEVAEYNDRREIDLGKEMGKVVLRYFVLNSSISDDQYYVKAEQALTLTLNGQRQHTKPRAWLKAGTGLHYLADRLIVVVDCSGLTNRARRQVFPSTRESAADTPSTKLILERVIAQLNEDDDLAALDEAAKESKLADSVEATTEKVKKQLATQISALMKGTLEGKKGGKTTKKAKVKRKRKPSTPRNLDDSAMPEIPDKLEILSKPFRIEPGTSKTLRLAISGKNGFIPDKFDDLKVVFGPELKDFLEVRATGRLLGGQMRVTIEAKPDTPEVSAALTVSMLSPELGLALMDKGTVEVVSAKDDEDEEDRHAGGEPNIKISWVTRGQWDSWKFNDESVGICNITRNGDTITEAAWILNRDFVALDSVRRAKDMSEDAEKSFLEGYQYAIAIGLFKQDLARTEAITKTSAADGASTDNGGAERPPAISDAYYNAEKARWARAILIAMEPTLSIEVDAAGELSDLEDAEEADAEPDAVEAGVA